MPVKRKPKAAPAKKKAPPKSKRSSAKTKKPAKTGIQPEIRAGDMQQ